MKKLLLILSATLFVVSCSNESYNPNSTNLADTDKVVGFVDSDVDPGKVIVKFTPDVIAAMPATRGMEAVAAVTGFAAIDKAFAQIGAVAMEPIFNIGGEFEERQREAGLHQWYVVDFNESMPATKAVPQLYGVEGIEVAEPSLIIEMPKPQIEYMENVITTFNTTIVPPAPNDPYYSAQRWHYDMINLEDAWKIEAGGPEVIVAVIDGGVDGTHEDLAWNMWRGPYNNYGYNCENNSTSVPADAHGTHVAGTVGAVNNNRIGLCGVAGGNALQGPGVRIMSLHITSMTGAIRAFQFATDNGAVITQNSWGIVQNASLTTAINYFVTNAGSTTGPMKGGLAVFAAGNSGINQGEYPANLSNVMSVAALAPDWRRATYSTYHSTVDICAPGGDSARFGTTGMIASTYPGNQYVYMEGTSMAAPHVSGVAALVLADDGGPGFTLAMLRQALLNTARPVSDPGMGAGCVDALAAVNYY